VDWTRLLLAEIGFSVDSSEAEVLLPNPARSERKLGPRRYDCI
jgi:hypothetical protein